MLKILSNIASELGILQAENLDNRCIRRLAYIRLHADESYMKVSEGWLWSKDPVIVFYAKSDEQLKCGDDRVRGNRKSV